MTALSGEALVVQLPDDMDPECINICNAINELPCIQTVESCCWHGNHPFRIWIHIRKGYEEHHLADLLWSLDKCHTGVSSWHCTIYTDCVGDRVSYLIESESEGSQAYAEADVIADTVRDRMS